MRRSALRNTLLLLALLVAVAIGAVSGATSLLQRQVGGFVAQVPPQTAAPTQPMPSQARHRQIPMKPGVALTSRLEPEDQIVEVIMGGVPFVGGFRNDEPEREIQIFTSTAAAVAVIEVTKEESAFASLTGGDEDWIRTTLTADVRSVLKDTTGQLVEGGLIEIQQTGGEVVLADGRRIIARDGLARLARAGGTYLAVLGFYEGRFYFGGLSSVEFERGMIKRMRLDAPPESDLEKKSPEWIVQQVRANADRRKP